MVWFDVLYRRNMARCNVMWFWMRWRRGDIFPFQIAISWSLFWLHFARQKNNQGFLDKHFLPHHRRNQPWPSGPQTSPPSCRSRDDYACFSSKGWKRKGWMRWGPSCGTVVVNLLTILAGQGHISGVFVLSQFLKRRWQATFKEKQISATTKKARDGCTIVVETFGEKKAAERLQLIKGSPD